MKMDAAQLRAAFTRFFAERGHRVLPAAGLIPHDPSVLFTIAGMVQFKPYFIGELEPPAPRATTIQPCLRTVDIDIIGTTSRHNTFFEMLGNFSFGDYFKADAIGYAYELVTEVLGIDPERLWVTVHESDADAAGLWQERAQLPAARIQKMGEDNFWRMGDTGPCGPSSEIYFDRGADYGDDGGPLHGGEERYVEIWNLVFMQYDQREDGTLVDLPRRNIDTGAGLERILALINGLDSVFETDVIAPVLEEAARLAGRAAGGEESHDLALRILADHARAMTMLVADGVFPSNEGRGYVLRRLVRRAVLRAQRLGVSELVTAPLAARVIEVLGGAYPKLVRDAPLIERVVVHEEEAFRRTLRSGSALFEEALQASSGGLPGGVAFQLHDTYGFPIDLTIEMAAGRGVEVDVAGFDAAMEEQRQRARAAGASAAAAKRAAGGSWSELVEQFGPSEFLGYRLESANARLLELRELTAGERLVSYEGEQAPPDAVLFEAALDRTPFYAEGGGQVGDTGELVGPTGHFRVLATRSSPEGVILHGGYLLEGELAAGAELEARIDGARRAAIRRNHTATHLLHWALRDVLGEHVGQQGSLVAPDRLRFDFSHFAPLTEGELERVEALVNGQILADASVRTFETTRAEAERLGAMAFFGDRYGEIVRVVEAGEASVELCGGTHVRALGMIGPFQVLSEGSIGASTRRIEATTGESSLDAFFAQRAQTLEQLAGMLRATPAELGEALERTLVRERELDEELAVLRRGQLRVEASELAASALGGRLAARRDGLSANELRELALATRDIASVEAVGLIGATPDQKVALVVAIEAGRPGDAKAIAAEVARLVGGGGGGSKELATAGGREIDSIDAALARLRELLASSPAAGEHGRA